VGTLQNNGLAGPATGYQLQQVLRVVTAAPFPRCWRTIIHLRNWRAGDRALAHRVAEADRARDEVLVKQTQVRYSNPEPVALQIEDALIAMRRSRASYEAASQARKYQQESLEAEQARFEVGASTAFFVIQYESLLAQAESTEVAAKSSWLKARPRWNSPPAGC